MTASDASAALLDDGVESRLLHLAGAVPSARALDSMDARIRALTAASPAATSARRSRIGRRGLALGLAFAMLVVAGAGGGLQSLYDAMAGGAGGSRIQWDQATVLNLSDTVNGYRATVERAYADPNEVMVAVSVVDAGNHPSSQIGTSLATLVDDQGHVYDMVAGQSSPADRASTADLLWFRGSGEATGGSRTFHLSLPTISVRDLSTPPPSEDPTWMPWHELSGPWNVAFTLAVHPADMATPMATATVNGTTIQLRSVVATDATIRAEIAIDAPSGVVTMWAPIGAFEHAGTTYPIAQTTDRTARSPDASDIESLTSTDRRAGTWTLRIDRIIAPDTSDSLVGPWILLFALP